MCAACAMRVRAGAPAVTPTSTVAVAPTSTVAVCTPAPPVRSMPQQSPPRLPWRRPHVYRGGVHSWAVGEVDAPTVIPHVYRGGRPHVYRGGVYAWAADVRVRALCAVCAVCAVCAACAACAICDMRGEPVPQRSLPHLYGSRSHIYRWCGSHSHVYRSRGSLYAWATRERGL